MKNFSDIFEGNGVWEQIPERYRGGLERYVKYGIAPGGFLLAVLQNDLHQAVSRADDGVTSMLRPICFWLYNEAPGGCWGSKDFVKEWIAKGGLKWEDSDDA